jgi:hypothetical protein
VQLEEFRAPFFKCINNMMGIPDQVFNDRGSPRLAIAIFMQLVSFERLLAFFHI